MQWECDLCGTYTANAQGIRFTLVPTSWSIWTLEQAQASAAYIANLKASGANPWVPGCQVKLFYLDTERNADSTSVKIRNSKGGYQPRKAVTP